MEQIANKKHYFQFASNSIKKGVCPKCKIGEFQYYKGLPYEYGICERPDSCGYHNNPYNQNEITKKELYNMVNNTTNKQTPEPTKKIIVPSAEQLKVLENHSSLFHDFCINNLGITKEHLQKWNVGTDKRGNTAFVLQDITGRYLNIKFMRYVSNNNDCKRDKTTPPYYLKPKETEQYDKRLFGEHLLKDDKITCVVESEKTAVICAFKYPQFNWVSTGGNNGATLKVLSILKGRQVYYLADNDKAGNNNSIIDKLHNTGIDFEKVFFETAKDGEDLADLIIRGEQPEIKPLAKEPIIEQQKESTISTTKNKNISEWQKVENFISERYELRNNIVSNKIESRELISESKDFKELNENNIFRELQINFINFSIGKLKSMLGCVFVKEFNPFKHYFENLPEYNPLIENDYITNVTTYLPVKDKNRLEVQFKKMLVRCIACSTANVVNKQAFVLVHDKQNSGKTTFLRWLTPPALKNYIAENINIDKDSQIAMCTNFFINMDELATLSKTEINSLKSTMSKDVFKGRLPYAARETNLIRRANIIGSTNNIEFLSDETGSVRWLCFELLNNINFDYNKHIDINRVWAQAYHLFKSGFKYELTPQEIQENESANANHRIVTAEQESIQSNFVPSLKGELGSEFKTATDIKRMLDHLYPGERLNITIIGKALKILGFERVSDKPPNSISSIKGYYIKSKNI